MADWSPEIADPLVHALSACFTGSISASFSALIFAASIVQILNCDIVAEEKCARISDHSDSNPMPARMLIARRDNLRETIAALELRLRADQRVSVPADPA